VSAISTHGKKEEKRGEFVHSINEGVWEKSDRDIEGREHVIFLTRERGEEGGQILL